jgi:hypothetical protein
MTNMYKYEGQTNKIPKQGARQSAIFLLPEDMDAVMPAEGSLV